MSAAKQKSHKVLSPSDTFQMEDIDLALQQIEIFIDLLEKSSKITFEEKIDKLMKISNLVTQSKQHLLPEPKPAPFTYTGRPIPKMTGVEFLQKYYGAYLGKTLHLGHIRSFDISLYRKLMRERRDNNGVWPDKIDLPTKNTAIDREVSNLSSEEIKRIIRLAANLKTR